MTHHRRTRRWAPLAALVATAALVLTGCAQSADTTSSSSANGSTTEDAGTPQTGGTLRVSFPPDNPTLTCLDPFQVYWIESRVIIRNFADSLTDQDPDTGEIVPWLAKSWEISEDGLTYTFTLRDDVTFADGTALDAAAVKTNFDGFLDAAANIPGVYGAVYIRNLESVEAPDATTVVFSFSAPNAAFLQATSTTNTAILAPSAFDSSAEERCLGTGLVGSGPFTLESYTPNEKTVLKRRTGYAWASGLNSNKGDAYLDGIEFDYVAEASVRTGNLVSGATDIAWPRDPFSEADRTLIKGSGLALESRSLPGPANSFYANTQPGKVLADANVRAAVNKGIDRTEYAQTVYGADYPVVTSVLETTTPYYVDQSASLGYDPDGAKAEIEKSGYTLGADGYYAKDGQKLTLVLPVTNAQDPGSQLVQAQLKKIGVEVTLDVFTSAERADVIAGGEYDLLGSYMSRGDPTAIQAVIDPRTASSKVFAENAIPADLLPELEAILDKGYAETDTTKRGEAYAELQEFLLTNNLAFPFAERVWEFGVTSKLKGFQFTSEAFGNFYNAWLEQ